MVNEKFPRRFVGFCVEMLSRCDRACSVLELLLLLMEVMCCLKKQRDLLEYHGGKPSLTWYFKELGKGRAWAERVEGDVGLERVEVFVGKL